MPKGKRQFVGLCGAYYVAYCATGRCVHSALTVGNAPNIDVLLSAVDGARLLALQVKTSRNAHRPNRYGRELREWQVGPSLAKLRNDSLWYAFVDLREKGGMYHPEVFLVPSHWAAGFCLDSNFDTPWEQWGHKWYWLLKEIESECKERWDQVEKFLVGDEEVLRWVRGVPAESLWPGPHTAA
jgi:hypothetical protein